MSLLIVDADVIAYRAGFATDKTKYLVHNPTGYHEFDNAVDAKKEEGIIWSRKEAEPEDKALMLVSVMIGDIRDRFAKENLSLRLYLSGVGNFRNSVATRATYKGNRSGTPQPTHMRAIREHLIDKGAIASKGEEADDLIGIAATENPGSVVCSIDKDLLQLPGRHYNFVTREEETVSQKDAVLNFYTQVIAGDRVDNVPGCEGYGPVKARKALEGCKNPYECWRTALDVYGSVYGADGAAFALETAQLVYIRRTVGEMWSAPAATKTQRQAA